VGVVGVAAWWEMRSVGVLLKMMKIEKRGTHYDHYVKLHDDDE
jgi:hypothetical protein